MTKDILMATDEVEEPKTDTARNQLQQYCLLAKTTQGNATLDLVKQVLEAPNIYVFGEFMAMPVIKELETGCSKNYYKTLSLFAYGTYKQYRENVSDYIPLTPPMLKKLQHLTIVSIAIKTKSIPYSVLLEELDIENVRHLEDIIIEAIYADILHGKLYQDKRILEVDYAQGRDIPPNITSDIVRTLEDWITACDAITNCFQQQILHANAEKAKRIKNKAQIEAEMNTLRKSLKNQVADPDDTMDTHDTASSSSSGVDVRKKQTTNKTRSVRVTTKENCDDEPMQ